MNQALNEYQRQAYLGALGLEQYVPRWRLPCAPEPVACELPVLAGGASSPSQTQPQAQPSSQSLSQPPSQLEPPVPENSGSRRDPPQALNEVLRDMAAPAETARPERVSSVPETVAASVAPEAAPVQPFSLSIWRSSLPLLVLDARQPRSAMPTERLLRNLLAALGSAEVAAGAREEILPWPSVNNPALRLRAGDARAELHTWLEMELAERPVQQLLLMGKEAAEHFLPEQEDCASLLWQRLDLEPFGCRALVTPSLVELLREPLLKRQLWHAVQPMLPMVP